MARECAGTEKECSGKECSSGKECGGTEKKYLDMPKSEFPSQKIATVEQPDGQVAIVSMGK